MSGDGGLPLTIMLFVPDQISSRLSRAEVAGSEILSNHPELSFLPPPWWEVSHTVKLGLASSMGMLAGS